MPTFSDIVDAADSLSSDEQQVLLELLQRRIAERNRALLVREVAEARTEFAHGGAKPASVKDIMDEVCGES
jgi:hypothetical protein